MIKILLVDDHKMVRDGIKLILQPEQNIEVVAETSNGEGAIEYLKENYDKIDITLLDITMPSLNGIKVTEILIKLFPKIKILALTMHNEESYILKMIKAGAMGYVLKDTDKAGLIKAIVATHKGTKYFSNDISVKLINSLLDNKNHVTGQYGLSKRELQVMYYISRGKTNSQMAEYLLLSRRTVESHRHNILKKLKISTTAELIVLAVKKGLV